MAESADAPGLNPGTVRCEGSNPSRSIDEVVYNNH